MSDIKFTVYLEPDEDGIDLWPDKEFKVEINSRLAEAAKEVGRIFGVKVDFWDAEDVEHECEEQGHQFRESEHPVGPVDRHDCHMCIHCEAYQCELTRWGMAI